MDFKLIKQNKKGFIVLVSVMVTTIILTVGIGVLNLALREFILANVGRDSLKAFYAADTGIECLFNYDITDKKLDGTLKLPNEPFFATPFDSDAKDPGTGGNPNDTIVCNGQSFSTGPSGSGYIVENAADRCDGNDCAKTYLLRTNNSAATTKTEEDALCLGTITGGVCTDACVMMEVRKIKLPGNIQRTELYANGVSDCDGQRRVERALVLTWE